MAAVNRIEIKDFLVFKGRFVTEFCSGVNVIIGENSTGKTTLLKALYWACQLEYKGVKDKQDEEIDPSRGFESQFLDGSFIQNYFDGGNYPLVKDPEPGTYNSTLRVSCFPNNGDEPVLNVSFPSTLDGTRLHMIGESARENTGFFAWHNSVRPSVFIPSAEMLSHSRGFLALNRERHIPFDKTEVDIIAKAELEPTRKITPNAGKTLKIIENIIGGEVVFDGKNFYIDKKALAGKVPFSFEASGYRKLGLLWKLLRNGLLEAGTIFFWDEPENSLNPELVPVLVDILLELSRNGVQIFVATHSELLASYFAVNRNRADKVRFLSLYKDGEQVQVNADDRFDLLEPNTLAAESVRLYEKEIEKGLGGNG